MTAQPPASPWRGFPRRPRWRARLSIFANAPVTPLHGHERRRQRGVPGVRYGGEDGQALLHGLPHSGMGVYQASAGSLDEMDTACGALAQAECPTRRRCPPGSAQDLRVPRGDDPDAEHAEQAGHRRAESMSAAGPDTARSLAARMFVVPPRRSRSLAALPWPAQCDLGPPATSSKWLACSSPRLASSMPSCSAPYCRKVSRHAMAASGPAPPHAIDRLDEAADDLQDGAERRAGRRPRPLRRPSTGPIPPEARRPSSNTVRSTSLRSAWPHSTVARSVCWRLSRAGGRVGTRSVPRAWLRSRRATSKQPGRPQARAPAGCRRALG